MGTLRHISKAVNGKIAGPRMAERDGQKAESRPDARRLVRPGAAAGKYAAGEKPAVIGQKERALKEARMRVVPRRAMPFVPVFRGMKGVFWF